jgi:hypothetical protein
MRRPGVILAPGFFCAIKSQDEAGQGCPAKWRLQLMGLYLLNRLD